MECPKCQKETKSNVIDSRPHGSSIRRIRVCNKCNCKWKTFEVTEQEYDVASNHLIPEETVENKFVSLLTTQYGRFNPTQALNILMKNRKEIYRFSRDLSDIDGYDLLFMYDQSVKLALDTDFKGGVK
jgi:transcriptional regulator NrdR family protein